VPTGFIGTRRRFEWDRHLPELPNLNWQQVGEMVALGHEIGSHSVNHVNMGEVSAETAWHELTMSRQTIEDRLGRPCRYFAYPFGGRNHFRSEFLPMIEQAGYEGCLSAFGGFVRPGCDDRLLPREAVPYFKSLSHLELHLSGCLNWWYAFRGCGQRQTEVPQGFEDRPSEMHSFSRAGFLSSDG
ncbi:MAG: polysaccharide deacetylase family protein, partial [Gemmataceae bacterium]